MVKPNKTKQQTPPVAHAVVKPKTKQNPVAHAVVKKPGPRKGVLPSLLRTTKHNKTGAKRLTSFKQKHVRPPVDRIKIPNQRQEEHTKISDLTDQDELFMLLHQGGSAGGGPPAEIKEGLSNAEYSSLSNSSSFQSWSGNQVMNKPQLRVVADKDKKRVFDKKSPHMPQPAAKPLEPYQPKPKAVPQKNQMELDSGLKLTAPTPVQLKTVGVQENPNAPKSKKIPFDKVKAILATTNQHKNSGVSKESGAAEDASSPAVDAVSEAETPPAKPKKHAFGKVKALLNRMNSRPPESMVERVPVVEPGTERLVQSEPQVVATNPFEENQSRQLVQSTAASTSRADDSLAVRNLSVPPPPPPPMQTPPPPPPPPMQRSASSAAVASQPSQVAQTGSVSDNSVSRVDALRAAIDNGPSLSHSDQPATVVSGGPFRTHYSAAAQTPTDDTSQSVYTNGTDRGSRKSVQFEPDVAIRSVIDSRPSSVPAAASSLSRGSQFAPNNEGVASPQEAHSIPSSLLPLVTPTLRNANQRTVRSGPETVVSLPSQIIPLASPTPVQTNRPAPIDPEVAPTPMINNLRGGSRDPSGRSSESINMARAALTTEASSEAVEAETNDAVSISDTSSSQDVKSSLDTEKDEGNQSSSSRSSQGETLSAKWRQVAKEKVHDAKLKDRVAQAKKSDLKKAKKQDQMRSASLRPGTDKVLHTNQDVPESSENQSVRKSVTMPVRVRSESLSDEYPEQVQAVDSRQVSQAGPSEEEHSSSSDDLVDENQASGSEDRASRSGAGPSNSSYRGRDLVHTNPLSPLPPVMHQQDEASLSSQDDDSFFKVNETKDDSPDVYESQPPDLGVLSSGSLDPLASPAPASDAQSGRTSSSLGRRARGKDAPENESFSERLLLSGTEDRPESKSGSSKLTVGSRDRLAKRRSFGGRSKKQNYNYGDAKGASSDESSIEGVPAPAVDAAAMMAALESTLPRRSSPGRTRKPPSPRRTPRSPRRKGKNGSKSTGGLLKESPRNVKPSPRSNKKSSKAALNKRASTKVDRHQGGEVEPSSSDGEGTIFSPIKIAEEEPEVKRVDSPEKALEGSSGMPIEIAVSNNEMISDLDQPKKRTLSKSNPARPMPIEESVASQLSESNPDRPTVDEESVGSHDSMVDRYASLESPQADKRDEAVESPVRRLSAQAKSPKGKEFGVDAILPAPPSAKTPSQSNVRKQSFGVDGKGTTPTEGAALADSITDWSHAESGETADVAVEVVLNSCNTPIGNLIMQKLANSGIVGGKDDESAKPNQLQSGKDDVSITAKEQPSGWGRFFGFSTKDGKETGGDANGGEKTDPHVHFQEQKPTKESGNVSTALIRGFFFPELDANEEKRNHQGPQNQVPAADPSSLRPDPPVPAPANEDWVDPVPLAAAVNDPLPEASHSLSAEVDWVDPNPPESKKVQQDNTVPATKEESGLGGDNNSPPQAADLPSHDSQPTKGELKADLTANSPRTFSSEQVQVEPTVPRLVHTGRKVSRTLAMYGSKVPRVVQTGPKYTPSNQLEREEANVPRLVHAEIKVPHLGRPSKNQSDEMNSLHRDRSSELYVAQTDPSVEHNEDLRADLKLPRLDPSIEDMHRELDLPLLDDDGRGFARSDPPIGNVHVEVRPDPSVHELSLVKSISDDDGENTFDKYEIPNEGPVQKDEAQDQLQRSTNLLVDELDKANMSTSESDDRYKGLAEMTDLNQEEPVDETNKSAPGVGKYDLFADESFSDAAGIVADAKTRELLNNLEGKLDPSESLRALSRNRPSTSSDSAPTAQLFSALDELGDPARDDIGSDPTPKMGSKRLEQDTVDSSESLAKKLLAQALSLSPTESNDFPPPILLNGERLERSDRSLEHVTTGKLVAQALSLSPLSRREPDVIDLTAIKNVEDLEDDPVWLFDVTPKNATNRVTFDVSPRSNSVVDLIDPLSDESSERQNLDNSSQGGDEPSGARESSASAVLTSVAKVSSIPVVNVEDAEQPDIPAAGLNGATEPVIVVQGVEVVPAMVDGRIVASQDHVSPNAPVTSKTRKQSDKYSIAASSDEIPVDQKVAAHSIGVSSSETTKMDQEMVAPGHGFVEKQISDDDRASSKQPRASKSKESFAKQTTKGDGAFLLSSEKVEKLVQQDMDDLAAASSPKRKKPAPEDLMVSKVEFQKTRAPEEPPVMSAQVGPSPEVKTKAERLSANFKNDRYADESISSNMQSDSGSSGPAEGKLQNGTEQCFDDFQKTERDESSGSDGVEQSSEEKEDKGKHTSSITHSVSIESVDQERPSTTDIHREKKRKSPSRRTSEAYPVKSSGPPARNAKRDLLDIIFEGAESLVCGRHNQEELPSAVLKHSANEGLPDDTSSICFSRAHSFEEDPGQVAKVEGASFDSLTKALDESARKNSAYTDRLYGRTVLTEVFEKTESLIDGSVNGETKETRSGVATNAKEDTKQATAEDKGSDNIVISSEEDSGKFITQETRADAPAGASGRASSAPTPEVLQGPLKIVPEKNSGRQTPGGENDILDEATQATQQKPGLSSENGRPQGKEILDEVLATTKDKLGLLTKNERPRRIAGPRPEEFRRLAASKVERAQNEGDNDKVASSSDGTRRTGDSNVVVAPVDSSETPESAPRPPFALSEESDDNLVPLGGPILTVSSDQDVQLDFTSLDEKLASESHEVTQPNLDMLSSVDSDAGVRSEPKSIEAVIATVDSDEEISQQLGRTAAKNVETQEFGEKHALTSTLGDETTLSLGLDDISPEQNSQKQEEPAGSTVGSDIEIAPIRSGETVDSDENRGLEPEERSEFHEEGQVAARLVVGEVLKARPDAPEESPVSATSRRTGSPIVVASQDHGSTTPLLVHGRDISSVEAVASDVVVAGGVYQEVITVQGTPVSDASKNDSEMNFAQQTVSSRHQRTAQAGPTEHSRLASPNGPIVTPVRVAGTVVQSEGSAPIVQSVSATSDSEQAIEQELAQSIATGQYQTSEEDEYRNKTRPLSTPEIYSLIDNSVNGDSSGVVTEVVHNGAEKDEPRKGYRVTDAISRGSQWGRFFCSHPGGAVDPALLPLKEVDTASSRYGAMLKSSVHAESGAAEEETGAPESNEMLSLDPTDEVMRSRIQTEEHDSLQQRVERERMRVSQRILDYSHFPADPPGDQMDVPQLTRTAGSESFDEEADSLILAVTRSDGDENYPDVIDSPVVTKLGRPPISVVRSVASRDSRDTSAEKKANYSSHESSDGHTPAWEEESASSGASEGSVPKSVTIKKKKNVEAKKSPRIRQVLERLRGASRRNSQPGSSSTSSGEATEPVDVDELFTRYNDIVKHMVVLDEDRLKRAQKSRQSPKRTRAKVSSERPRTSPEKRRPASHKLEEARDRGSPRRTQKAWQSPETNRATESPKQKQLPEIIDVTEMVMRSTSSGRKDDAPARSPKRGSSHDIRQTEAVYARSTSYDSESTNPLQKARNLRYQLDQALKTSAAIKNTQERLGMELSTFKNKLQQQRRSMSPGRTLSPRSPSSSQFSPTSQLSPEGRSPRSQQLSPASSAAREGSALTSAAVEESQPDHQQPSTVANSLEPIVEILDPVTIATDSSKFTKDQKARGLASADESAALQSSAGPANEEAKKHAIATSVHGVHTASTDPTSTGESNIPEGSPEPISSTLMSAIQKFDRITQTRKLQINNKPTASSSPRTHASSSPRTDLTDRVSLARIKTHPTDESSGLPSPASRNVAGLVASYSNAVAAATSPVTTTSRDAPGQQQQQDAPASSSPRQQHKPQSPKKKSTAHALIDDEANSSDDDDLFDFASSEDDDELYTTTTAAVATKGESTADDNNNNTAKQLQQQQLESILHGLRRDGYRK